jgi:hypothetical protein
MSVEVSKQTTGVLLHGRHLESIQWENMMWGSLEAGQIGSAPTMVRAILDEGPEKIAALTIGTGASTREDGKAEAEVVQELILERFDELDEFELIGGHPLWKPNRGLIKGLVEQAELDTESRSTKYEVARAGRLFTGMDINRVIQVTGKDHGPRCQLSQGLARREGFIPPEQMWYMITDNVSYLGGIAGGTVVLEQPHRGDDETMSWEPGLWPAMFMSKFFDLPRGRRHMTARLMQDVIQRVGRMDEASFLEMQEEAGNEGL